MPHLLDAQTAAFEACQVVDPCDASLVEDASVVLVSFEARHESRVAIELQCFVIHAGQLTGLLHRIGFHVLMEWHRRDCHAWLLSDAARQDVRLMPMDEVGIGSRIVLFAGTHHATLSVVFTGR